MPNHWARLGKDWLLLAVAGLSVVGGLLILLREINYGAGVNWDSVMYMSTAESLAAGKGFYYFGGSPLTGWPPLFPILMAPFVFLGVDTHSVAGFVNAAAFGLTILFSGLWLRKRLESRWLTLWGTLAVALSIPLTVVAAFALSEPLFALFTLLALIQTDKFLERNRRSDLIWAAVFTALACLTRYMGGTIIIAVALLLLLQRNASLTERGGRIAAYSLISVIPVCLWLLRNYLATGRFTGLTSGGWEPVTPIPENLRHAAETMAGWVVPLSELPSIAQDLFTLLAAIFLLSSAVAGGYILIRRWRGSGGGIDWGPLAPFGVFTAVYFILLIASGLSVEIGSGNFSRYLAPVYSPLVLAIAVVAQRLLLACGPGKIAGHIGNWPIIRTFVWGGG